MSNNCTVRTAGDLKHKFVLMSMSCNNTKTTYNRTKTSVKHKASVNNR